MKTSFSVMCSALGHVLPRPLSDEGPSNAELMLLMAMWDVYCDSRVTAIFPDEASARAAKQVVEGWFGKLQLLGDAMKFDGLALKFVASIQVPSPDGGGSVSLPALSMWTANKKAEGRIYVSPGIFGPGLSGPYRFAHRVQQAEGAQDVVDPDGTLLLRVDPNEVEGAFSGHFVRLGESSV